MSLTVGPLSMGLMSAWLSLTVSRYCHTVPLGLCTSTELLHHSAISSTFNVAIISCLSNLSDSFYMGSYSACATYLGGTWFDFASSSLSKKVPLMHPILVNKVLNAMCIWLLF